jgi:hypothetical protein
MPAKYTKHSKLLKKTAGKPKPVSYYKATTHHNSRAQKVRHVQHTCESDQARRIMDIAGCPQEIPEPQYVHDGTEAHYMYGGPPPQRSAVPYVSQ